MQFIDLNKQQQNVKESLDRRIQDVLNHGQYIHGPEVKELEEKLANFTNRKHAIAVANGSDALVLALMALEIGEGDAVFTPSFTFFASASCVPQVGATPVFVDIEKSSFNIDPKHLEKQIQKVIAEGKLKPKAIIAVDLFGLMANYEKLQSIAKKYDLYLIEDAAQSFGASQNGKKSCSYGVIATTSFFPAKPLGCYGDGGMIFTDDDKLNEMIRSLSVHGKGSDKYDNVRIGRNSRLDTLQAAILLAKFEVLEEEINKRQEVAKYYTERLKEYLLTPLIPMNNVSAWAQYTLRSGNRDGIMKSLNKAGIPSVIYYPKPLHLQTAFNYLKIESLPVTEKLVSEVFSIPFHPYMEKDEQDLVIKTILSDL